jgi:hypothetical protein
LKDEPVVLEAQEKALAMADGMDAEMEDMRMKQHLQAAAEHMEAAIKELKAATNSTAPLPKALACEQAAYQALLKLQAREFQVVRSQSRSQQGQQQASQRNQGQLDQLDLKQQQDRYETPRRRRTRPRRSSLKC